MKQKTIFRCTACGHEESKWLGRCPGCGNWNTLEETAGENARRTVASPGEEVIPVPLESIDTGDSPRLSAGIDEIDRVLGGGMVSGSLVLVGGEPGIGKSTLMLQIAAHAAVQRSVLYVSGEESAPQIKMRARRLGIGEAQGRIEVLSSSSLEAVLNALNRLEPLMVIIDSIQTMRSGAISSTAGTVTQIRLCVEEVGSWVKQRGGVLFLVGHVTKEGAIAGPKVVEHLVDTVLYFDEADNEVRFLRASKNRFGSVDEIAIFRMGERGLMQVDDPRRLFLLHRDHELPAGVAIAPIYEGSRVLLVEIQSLVVPAKGGMARVYSDRIDASRVSRMAAVLEKHVRLSFSDRDIYVNVAGGIRISEVAAELPLAMALYSARTGLPIPSHMGITGEVSLAGEIREVSRIQRRVRAMSETGYTAVIGPAEAQAQPAGTLYRAATSIAQAVSAIFGSPADRGA